jgi:hypothetical protein
VALAVLALLVGGLIVAGNLLGQDDVASVASHSPQSTERPSPTPRPTIRQIPTPAPTPTPAPIGLVLEPAPVPTVAPTLFSGWIRARVELQILGAPELGSAPIRVLAKGELISASEQPDYLGVEGWLTVGAGWIATREAGVDLVDRYPQPPSAASGYVSTLAAGPDGFVGIGGTSAAYPPSMLLSSADGARWQVASAPVSGLTPQTAVWGPAGWLLTSADLQATGGQAWLSSSADGSQWKTLGMLRASNGAMFPRRLAASDAGYLLEANPSLGSQAAALWFSVDGVNWHEVHPGPSSSDYMIGGTTGGFYAWTEAGYAPEAAFSVDGVTWSPVAGGPVGLNLQPVAVGDRWFAIETYDVATFAPLAAPRPWLGRVSGGGLSWQSMPGAAAFSGAVVTALVATGDEAIAFGWDPATGAGLTWISTGSDWTRSELPVAFRGGTWTAAAGRSGVVAVGQDGSVVWHRSAGGAWQPEPDPVITPLPEPSLADCAPQPRDGLAFVLLDWSTRAFCYGDATISFRGWSTPCQMYCDSESDGGKSEPEWLAAPSANRLFLSLAQSDTNASIQAILPPALATSPPAAWLDTWLEVRGHFDDAAAATCRYTPPQVGEPYYHSAESTVNACRQQFVVSSLRVVSGP